MKPTAKLRRKILELTWTLREMSRTSEEMKTRVIHLTRQVKQEQELRLAQMYSLPGLEKFRLKT